MRHLQKLTVVAFALLMISGCGGSSSGGGGGGTDLVPEGQDKSSIPITTSTIRQITPGDTWDYTATATMSAYGETMDLTGTYRVQILSTTQQSPITLDNCLDEYTLLTLSGGGETAVAESHSYFLQGEDGSIYEYGVGDEEGDAWIESPIEGFYKVRESSYVTGAHNEWSLSYTDGSTAVYSYSVGDIEAVCTDKDVFDAYLITTNVTYHYPFSNEMYTGTTKNWCVPSIGTVKADMNVSYYTDGLLDFTMSVTATLSSTSVSY